MKKILLFCLFSITLQCSDNSNNPRPKSILLELFQKDPAFNENLRRSDERIRTHLAANQNMPMEERITLAVRDIKQAQDINAHLFAQLCMAELFMQLKSDQTTAEEEKKQHMENGLQSLTDGERRAVLMYSK